MHSETFYATTAQIFPALLIALVVELGSIVKLLMRDRERNLRIAPTVTPLETRENRNMMLFLAATSGAAFLAGETLAVLCLGFR